MSEYDLRMGVSFAAPQSQIGKIEDPLLRAFTEVGAALLVQERLREDAESRVEYFVQRTQEETGRTRAAREDLAKTQIQVASAVVQQRALHAFVRELAGDNGKPPRSKAQQAARELLNEIGWTAR